MFRTKKIFSFNHGEESLKQVVISKYDDQQNEITRLIYNENKELGLIVKKEFDHHNNLLNSKTVNRHGQLQSEVYYHYDPLQHLLEKRFFKEGKKLLARNVWTYEQDRLIKFEKIKNEHQLVERKEYKYNKDHKLAELWIFNNEGKLATKRIFSYQNDLLTEEKIFSPTSILKARKIIRHNESKLPEVIFWFDSQGKVQRTEYFEYYPNGHLKTEVVNDIFGQHFFRKKFNSAGQVFTSYHLKQDHFEKLELYFYDVDGKKIKQEKYAINSNQKFLEQKIIYRYDTSLPDYTPEKIFLPDDIL